MVSNLLERCWIEAVPYTENKLQALKFAAIISVWIGLDHFLKVCFSGRRTCYCSKCNIYIYIFLFLILGVQFYYPGQNFFRYSTNVTGSTKTVLIAQDRKFDFFTQTQSLMNALSSFTATVDQSKVVCFCWLLF